MSWHVDDRQLIVADTGPLISLTHIGQLTLLTHFYTEVLVPAVVADELKAS